MKPLSPGAALLACLALSPALIHAGGPRFVSGTAGYANGGTAMAFYTPHPFYFTDPADLSPTVTHAQADAMVAAAAAVWNVAPTSLILQQGGQLAEHVSSANSYFDGTAVVFPADVQPSNYLAKPIAIVYDTDGSVIDLLLGEGASDPSSCRQNAVIESVDAFAYSMAINHAVIVLNGRCIDSPTAKSQQLLQMQYQLTRIFGRVLGLSWSQNNDNAFTGNPVPTTIQLQNWPVMHPIDILCGPYSYQCMQQPFTLRTDDISALALLYPDYSSSPPSGKQSTSFDAVYFWGNLNFANGQGAELVNMALRIWPGGSGAYQSYQTASTVTGFQFQQNGGNPIAGPEPALLNAGANYSPVEGSWYLPWIPTGTNAINVEVQSETVNPLYWGEHAVGAYQRPVISMPGSQATGYAWTIDPRQVNFGIPTITLVNAPSSCNPGSDGSESAPAPVSSTGWWSGLLCGVGHSSWFTTTIRANHTWTLEATALNESGQATINKAQPVLGVWNLADATGTLPTIAAAPVAMNSLALGTTQLHVPAATADAAIRLTVADQFGAGRPDFTYTGRILYADSVTPSTVPVTGGQITITGTGFRLGNIVSVNGVRATVLSWTANQIVANTPSQTAARAGSAPVDVLVTDASTAGTTDIPAALTFAGAGPPPVNAVAITTPNAWLAAGAGSQWTITLAATQNSVPIAATPVTWSASSSLTLSSAQPSTGTAGTASAIAKVAAIPAASTNNMTGCAWTNVCATWTVYGVDAPQWIIAPASGATQSIHAPQALAPVILQVTDTAGHPLPGAPVSLYQTVYAWEGPCTTTRCPSAPVLTTSSTTAISDASGLIIATPLQLPNIPQTVAIAAATGPYGFATTTLTIAP
jgi:hypothetical protein